MKGMTFKLECPYFCCFRKPVSTSTMATYPIAPFTTLRGLISNAMGLVRNDFVLQEKLKIGISPLSRSSQFTELAKILKLKSTDRSNQPRIYPSSPMFKELLANPKMRVFVGFEDQDYFEPVRNSINDPARPLYIGQSDDLAVISEVQTYADIEKGSAKLITGIVSGVHSNCELVRLPLRFKDMSTLEYSPILSISCSSQYVTVEEPLECYFFGDERVQLF